MPTNKKRVNIALSDELYNDVKILSSKMGVPMSTYCTMIIAQSTYSTNELLSQVSDKLVSISSRIEDKEK